KEGDPVRLGAQRLLAMTYHSRKAYARAAEAYAELRGAQARALGRSSAAYAETLRNLGKVHAHRGDYEQLRRACTELVWLLRPKGPSAAGDLAWALGELGQAHASLGDAGRAGPLYREALAWEKRASGETSLRTFLLLGRLGL